MVELVTGQPAFIDGHEALGEYGTGVELEDTSGGGEITEPFDPDKIRVDARQMTIGQLITRIRHNELNLAPGFQRKPGIWTPVAQSRLIESILIRVPLPAFYFDVSDDDCWVVVDGLQRLTAIKRFVVENSLRLQGLEFLNQCEGQ